MTTMNSNQGDGHASPISDVNGHKAEDDRKLFVGGLTWDTTPDDLREYFSSFGNILDCSIKHDPTTGRSRGFAFLVFDRKEIVDKILSQNEHFVKGRKVDPKPAHRRLATSHNQTSSMSASSSMNSLSTTNPTHSSNNNNRKVFIGGLDPNFPDTQLREYFSQFGTIDEIDLPYDKEKNERRPFCFISFQNEQSAQEVLRLQRHKIGEITVDVKRAKPKTMNNQQQQQHQQLYDPYGQQSVYANYGAGVPSYGVNAYPTADPYATWNSYPYNQQGNPAAYSYGVPDGIGAGNSASSSYPQYSQHQNNSQYSYGPASGAVNANEYYSQYNYGAPHATSNIYADPNIYGGGGGSGSGSGSGMYDYPSYYTSGGVSGSMMENNSGQQGNNSPNETTTYEHDTQYGKPITSMISSSTYHQYPVT